METKNGTPCVNTGTDGTRVIKQTAQGIYVRVQILPPVPQRIEWVNERNLTGST